MNFSLLALSLIGVVLGSLIVRILVRMASERDAAMRHRQKRMIPFPEDNLTRWGHG